MTAVLGFFLAILALAGVVLLAKLSARWGEDREVPAGSPAWLGPDPVAVAETVRARLDARCAAAGAPAPLAWPAIEELAQVHAFDMATRNYAGERDPEGEDLAGRRARLRPDFAGETRELDACVPLAGEAQVAALAERLLKTLGGADLDRAFADPQFDTAGVGVAVERGRAAICLVLASVWGTVERLEEGDLPGTWDLLLRARDDAPAAAATMQVPVSAALFDAGGRVLTEVPLEPQPPESPDPGRFRAILRVPDGVDPGGARVELRRGERKGWRRSLLG